MNEYTLLVKDIKFIKSKRFDRKVWEKYELISLRVYGHIMTKNGGYYNRLVVFYASPFKMEWSSEQGRFIATNLRGFSKVVNIKETEVDIDKSYLLGRGFCVVPVFQEGEIIKVVAEEKIKVVTTLLKVKFESVVKHE